MSHFAAHGANKDVVLVQFVDDFARHAKARNVNTGAALDDGFQVSRNGIRRCCEKVNAERLVSEFTHTSHFRCEKFGAHGGSTKCANAACIGNCSNEIAVGNTAHASKHDGQFNVEHFGESCLHALHRSPVQQGRKYRTVSARTRQSASGTCGANDVG